MPIRPTMSSWVIDSCICGALPTWPIGNENGDIGPVAVAQLVNFVHVAIDADGCGLATRVEGDEDEAFGGRAPCLRKNQLFGGARDRISHRCPHERG
jgi:hypothetical protein